MERNRSEDVGTERALPFHGLLRRGPAPDPPWADDAPPAGAAGSVRASARERLALHRRLHVERRSHALLAPPALVGVVAHGARAPLASPVLVRAAVPRAAGRG